MISALFSHFAHPDLLLPVVILRKREISAIWDFFRNCGEIVSQSSQRKTNCPCCWNSDDGILKRILLLFLIIYIFKG